VATSVIFWYQKFQLFFQRSSTVLGITLFAYKDHQLLL